MKISTMLIIVVCLVTLGSLTAFNYQLKQVYLSGTYKSRFMDMAFTPLKGVENIDIQSANLLGVQIEQGEKEGIWISKRIKDNVVFKVNQQTLILDLTTSSKKLNSICTFPYFNTRRSETYSPLSSTVKGYRADHLDVQICQNLSFSLNGMQLNTLHAVVGNKVKGGAELVLSGDNKINNAQLDIPGKSRLTLLDPKIIKTNYNLSDSAAVSLSGKMIKMIK